VPIKLSRRDSRRVEVQTGRSVDDLTEQEPLDGMKRLGIQRLQFTADDEAAIERTDAGESS
jgi:hypothetical protein